MQNKGSTPLNRFKSSSRVLIVGCGGLGVHVATALAGECLLTLADDDVVELSNLPRQWGYDKADLGQNKASVCASRFRGLARGRVGADEPLGDYDLVIECSDDTLLKFALGDAAARAGVAFVVGGVAELMGFALSVLPKSGPCLRCIFEGPSEAMRTTCRDAGVLAPLPAIVAQVMIAYARRALARERSPFWSLDFASGTARERDWPRNPKCPTCAAAAT